MSDDYILVMIPGCEGNSSHQQATRHIHWLAGRPRCQPVKGKSTGGETSVTSNIYNTLEKTPKRVPLDLDDLLLYLSNSNVLLFAFVVALLLLNIPQ